jgi:hypothetical protein
MFDSIAGLVVAFILLAIVTAWNTIRTKGYFGLKVASICVLIWYGMVVYFTVPTIMGWPKEADLPANAKIISIKIVEPSKGNEGQMYFWLSGLPDHERDAINLLRPDKIFIYTGSQQPRAFKIPYDRELHKKLIEAKKKQKGQKGSLIIVGKKGIKTKNNREHENIFPTENPFKILNPFDSLKKDNSE